MAEQTKKNTQSSPTTGAGRSGKASPMTPTSGASQETSSAGGATGTQGNVGTSPMGNGGSSGLMRQVRSTAADAIDSAASKAGEKLEEQKSNLSTGLTSVASGIRDLGNSLSDTGANNQFARIASEASTAAAKGIERAADYFDQNDLNAVYKDVENFARRNPAVILGSAFALGFLAARFLKSNNPKRLTTAAGQPYNMPPQNRPRMGGEAARGL